MGKSNITLPPQNKVVSPKALVAAEKKISEVINKGGSTTKTADVTDDAVKNFNIKLLESELAQINELRDQRPRPRGQKRPGISLHGWLLEAINEKIENETKKYYNTEAKV
jgi:hypothetical protein